MIFFGILLPLMTASSLIQFPISLLNYRGEARRVQDLESVLRFDQAEKVIHRNNLHTHMLRVGYFSAALATHLRTNYDVHVDPEKTQRLAHYHDDPEIITGDIPTPIKYSMKPHERLALRKAEEEAIKELATRYFSVNPWKKRQYLSDQRDMTDKTSTEARIVNIADKIEGLCETLHEIRCGNETFDKILNNYRAFFASFIEKEQLFELVNADNTYKVTMDSIPTVTSARALESISLETFRSDPELFWKDVFADNLPGFYKQWLIVSATKLETRALFPGWKKELGNAKPSAEIIKNFIA